MNLALGAVFLAILLFPALVLIYVFGNGTHARKMPNFTLVEYLLLSAVLSIFIHGCSISLMDKFSSMKPDYVFIFKFLTNQNTLDQATSAGFQLELYFFDFIYYTLVVCISSSVAGLVIQKMVTWRWIRMQSWLQRLRNNRRPGALFSYFNDWWYLFRANEYSREFSFLESGKVLVYTDALVNTKETTILYKGILDDFVMKDQNLEFIYLNNVSKKLFVHKDDGGKPAITESQSSQIRNSGIMCIPYGNIINLYVRFMNPVLQINGPVFDDIPDPELENIIIMDSSEEEDEIRDPSTYMTFDMRPEHAHKWNRLRYASHRKARSSKKSLQD